MKDLSKGVGGEALPLPPHTPLLKYIMDVGEEGTRPKASLPPQHHDILK